MSRIFGGCASVSIVRATAGLRRNAGSFRAFLAVHMTISEPFQTNPIGIDRGVPSSPMKASRVRSRARSSWLSGWFSTSSIALWCMGRSPPWIDCVAMPRFHEYVVYPWAARGSVVVAAGAGSDPGDVGAVDVQADSGLAAVVSDAVDVTRRCEAADLTRVVVPRTRGVERFIEQFFVLGARQHAHDAPGDVVVDPRALPGAPDQAEDGECPVGLGVQHVAGGPARLTAALAGGQDAGAGQVGAQLIGDQYRGVRPVGSYSDHRAHRRDEIDERRLGRRDGQAVGGRGGCHGRVLLLRERGRPVQRAAGKTHSSNDNPLGNP